MINNKKGLSMIVSTLIIILLVLVAIGIIWTVVRNVINEGTETVNINSKCLEINLQVTAVNCEYDEGKCDVTVERNGGGSAIDGIRYVISDGSGSNYTDGAGIDELSISTNETSLGTATTGNATSAYAAAFFNNSAGESQLCAATADFTNINFTYVA